MNNYVPGFSNYLQSLALAEQPSMEGGFGLPFDPTYYMPPAAQPVAAEPYYGEPSYSLPAEQPVAAEPVAPAAYPAMPADYAQRAEENARRAYEQAASASFGARGELSKYLDDIDTSTAFDYSPEAAQYLYDVGRYPTENTAYDLSPLNLMKADPQTGAPLPYTSGQLEQYAQQPLADQFYANFNYGGADQPWDVGNLQFAPNQQYRLIDRSTGDVVYSGTGYEAGQNISELAKGMFDKSGQQANWLVQEAAPGSDQWSQRYEHVPDVNGFTTWLKMVAPMLGGALLAPVLGGGALASAAGSAIGSAGAGVAAGDSIGDILKNAALSGATSYAGGQLLGKLGVGNAPSGSVPSGFEADLMSLGVSPTTAANIASGLGGALPTDIVAVGAPKPSIGLPGPVSGGALNTVATTGPEPRRPDYGDKVQDQQPIEDQIVVTGAKQPMAPAFSAPNVTPFAPGPLDAVAPPTETIVAEAARRPEAPVPAPSFTPGPLDAVALPENEIVAEAKKPEGPINIATLPVAPSLAPNTSWITEPATVKPEAQPEKSTLDKVTDYISLAGKLAPVLGGLFGGGSGQQSGARISGAMSGLHPSFGGALPSANIPGLGGLTVGGGPRTAADLGQQGLRSPQDYYRYGYGPEQSFFGYVPQGAPNTSKAYTGYAEGGFAVEGPGDGREDKIPAMLSDGEYVIDAETVALLGNGSNKAGADMLDQFRVKVRKHKGRELARGDFSKDAKRPEQYLAGGRA